MVLPNYADITSRIKEQPKWWDAHGVPRYDNFNPRLISNIYASEVMLMKIECDSCRRKFDVEMTKRPRTDSDSLANMIAYIGTGLGIAPHYGDPPRHDCVGDVMNSTALKIKEFWRKDVQAGWVRMPECEVEYPD